MGKKIKIIGVIPARLKSTRLREKLLLEIKHKPLVWYTYSRVKKSRLDNILIAVDDEKLYNKLSPLGCPVVMTSKKHRSGTDRLGEVAEKFKADYYINIQGDEPLISPQVINKIIEYIYKHPKTEILTLGEYIRNKNDILDPGVVKAVFSKDSKALYFSRNPIPYDRDKSGKIRYVRHLGIYCFRKDILKKIIKLPPSYLECAEKLEQLRFLENGFIMDIIICKTNTVGVDTKEDFLKVKKIIERES